MQWSAWQNVHADYVIPPELLPCEAFQLEWFLEWMLPSGTGNSFTTHHGRWRWEARGSGDVKVFASDVDIYGTADWMGDELLVWYIQENANNPVIRTSVPERPPMTGVPSDATSWHQRADGSWQNEAESGLLLDSGWVPGAGGGLDVYVYGTYQSAQYLVPLSSGTVLKVPFHSVGAFLLPKWANLRIRTAGVGGFDAMFDEVGILRLAKPQNSVLRHVYSLDGGRNWQTRRLPYSLTQPTVAKLPDNTLLIAGKFAQVDWRLLRSLDDGLTYLPEVTVLWDNSYTDARLVVTRDGTILTVARIGGYLWARRSLDSYVETARVGPASKAMQLVCEPATGRLVATDGEGLVYTSWDDGRTWANA